MIQIGLSALAAAAVAALPATAVAGEPQIDPANGKFPVPFFATGGMLELRLGGLGIACSNYKAAGEVTSATTGTIESTFEKCQVPGGIACTSPGQPAGTIKFGKSVFHLVYLTDAKTVPGVLVTPPTGGVFGTSTCTGEIKGTGYMGQLESPACNTKSKTFSFSYEIDAEGKQKYRQVTGTGTSYNMLAGATEVALVSTNTWTLEQQATLTCV